MSDFFSIGNLAIGQLALLSILVWCLVATRWEQKRPAISRRPVEPNSWPPGTGLRAFFVAFVIPLALHFSIQSVLRWMSPGQRLHELAGQYVLITIQICVAAGMLTLETRGKWARDVGLRPIQWKPDLIIATLGFLASLVPVFTINLIILKLGWHSPDTRHPLLEMLSKDGSPWVIAAIVGVAAILAPLAEELMYRVALQTELERYLGENKAWVLTACLFAAVHSRDGRPDALPLFPLALILGYVYRQTRSYPAIVALHALFNTLNLAMTFVVQ